MSEGEAVANAAARAAESHAKSECCGESRRVTCDFHCGIVSHSLLDAQLT